MYELYSRRIKNAIGEPEVFIYDSFPQTFRNQMFYALSDVIDYFEANGANGVWDYIHNEFSREIGVKCLCPYNWNSKSKIEHFVEMSSDEEFLDLLDYAFSFVSKLKGLNIFASPEEKIKKITDSVAELNQRFKQHKLGYEFVNGEVIRKDNEFLHQAVVKPALKVLSNNEFAGAEQEFLDAFEHRRKGENKDAILDALKAFESTMKTICDKMGYPYDPAKSTAKDLISILETNNFYPSYMNNHITSLRTSLESGLPTLRNKNAGHGQGASVVNVSDEFTEYALNLAATNIVLLVKIYEAKSRGAQ